MSDPTPTLPQSLTAPIQPPTVDEMRMAQRDLQEVLVRTPLAPLRDYEERSPNVYLKVETHQPVTSFKLRGVFHAVNQLAPANRARGLATVSAGNTAQALAWTARHFGVDARCVMPESAPAAKVDAVQHYGGIPVLLDSQEVFTFLLQEKWRTSPYCFVHPWTDRTVMIGHATLALEIFEDMPDVETVFVPIGGGGLLGGVACALKELRPTIKVIAVEPAGCPSLAESFRQGKPARVDAATWCDGVAVPFITPAVFQLLKHRVDGVMLVKEESVARAVRELAFENRIIAEGAGALALAAAKQTPVEKRGKSVALVTGGSIDPTTLLKILGSEDYVPPPC